MSFMTLVRNPMNMIVRSTLFRNSLHAALTLEEVKENSETVGLSNAEIKQTSDRHWTLTYKMN